MDVRLPKLGENTDGGVVVSILVRPGDRIEVGQTLLELENEKAIAPVASPAAGTVAALRIKEGDKVSVGSVILTLEGAAPAPAPAAATPGPARPAARPAPRAAEPLPEDDLDDLPPEDPAGEGPTPPASPYVRKLARDIGLRLSRVRATGSGGRVTLEDIARHLARLERGVARAGRHAEEPRGLVFEPVNLDFAQFGPVTSEPLSPLRKVISARMVENKVSLPHVTQFDEADLSRIESLRARHKEAYEKAGARLTPTVFILKALVVALKKHPRLNSSLNEVTETLFLKHYYHLGIAVDTEAGLIVPVLRDADRKSMRELAVELAALAARARDRKIGADELRGGSFTISNQGAIGGGHFTPIINKPEAAILGLGRTTPKPVVTADGRIEARPMLPLAVSYDHRLIDGGTAARFTVDLVKALQEFPENEVQL